MGFDRGAASMLLEHGAGLMTGILTDAINRCWTSLRSLRFNLAPGRKRSKADSLILAVVTSQVCNRKLLQYLQTEHDRGRKSNYVYGASKGALNIFLDGVRNRLDRNGVHVLTIRRALLILR